MTYQVVVGNIGTILETDNLTDALEEYWYYVEMTERPGRAEGESVVVFKDGEILREHIGKGDEQ